MLVLTDDDTGKTTVDRQTLNYGLAGAVMIELAARGLLDVADEGEAVKSGRIVLRRGDPPTEPVLASALTVLYDLQGKKPQSALTKLSKDLHVEVVGGLVARGILRMDEHRVLGLFPVSRWPAEDSRHEAEVSRTLIDVLNGARTADPRSAALIALLSALDQVGKLDGLADKRDAKRRAKEIAASDWGATAVLRAVQAVQAAVTASIVASTVAATSASM